jgi:hypothetical protein
MSELGQNRKRTHGPWQSLSQLLDALDIAIAEKLGGLRQVRDAIGIESHEPRAGEVCRHRIVRHHYSPQISRRSLERSVAFHGDDAVRDHEMRGQGAVDIEDARGRSLPTFFRPAIDRAGDGANDAAEGQKTERGPYCEAPLPSLRERGPKAFSSRPPFAPSAANAAF